jgi:hypothetical protein
LKSLWFGAQLRRGEADLSGSRYARPLGPSRPGSYPGQRMPMNPITVAALEAFPQQLEAHYAAIPASFRQWAPPSWDGVPSEPLTAIEQLCHVRDIEVEGYHWKNRTRCSSPSTPTRW